MTGGKRPYTSAVGDEEGNRSTISAISRQSSVRKICRTGFKFGGTSSVVRCEGRHHPDCRRHPTALRLTNWIE